MLKNVYINSKLELVNGSRGVITGWISREDAISKTEQMVASVNGRYALGAICLY